MYLNISAKLPLKQFIYFFLILALYPFSFQNPQNIPEKAAAKQMYIKKQSGHEYFMVPQGTGMKVIDINMNEEVSIIAEFNEPPLFIAQKDNRLRKMGVDAYRQMQSAFSSDLGRLHESACRAYSSSFFRPQKVQEYYKVFNGAHLKVPRAMLNEIYSLPYIKKAHRVIKVKALLKEAVHITGADTLWARYKNQGDSVRIGILDSGIDYMHPALGGGIGKGFKVEGGYDFVNKDNDPMDDHGHGTHVACIAAGSAERVKGIAPKALLTAYKVLNNLGIGTSADIVAAIERCADPDGDNDMRDRLDIVNMSLGEDYGNPYDAVTLAVDNAVKLGIVFCIAAGNAGELAAIGSPGTAELAITVGASDKQDRVAAFSSAGPVKKTYIMKPEVLAPGDSIYSAVPGTEYEKWSGTSMASPVAAGVCALLRRQHKDWTPAMIKSALISTAKDFGIDMMQQGAGRIDAIKAVNAKTLSVPSQLNYGMDDSEAAVWSARDTIVVLNTGEERQDYTVSTGSIQGGITITSDINSFSLEGRAEQRLIVTLTVNNSALVHQADKEMSFGGKVRINGTRDTLSVPWTFVKSPVLMITFRKPYVFYCIYTKDEIYPDYRAWNQADSMYSEILLPEGKYNIAAIFSTVSDGIKESRFVLKQDVEVNGFKRITIDPDEANLSVTLDGVDEKGEKLSAKKYNSGYVQFDHSKPLLDLATGFLINENSRMKTSCLGEDIRIFAGQFSIDTEDEKAARVIQFSSINGIKENITLSNNSQNYIVQKVNIDMSVDSSQVSDILFQNRMAFWNLGIYAEGHTIRKNLWSGRLYLTPEVDSSYGFTARIIGHTADDILNYNWDTGPVRIISQDSISVFDGEYISNTKNDLNLGDGPVFYRWGYSSLYSKEDPPCFWMISNGKHNERIFLNEQNAVYTIYDINGSSVQKGRMNAFRPHDIEAGDFCYEIESDYYTVAGIRGHMKTRMNIKLPEYSLSPALTNFKILNESGVPVSRLKKGVNARLVFSTRSFNSSIIDTINTKIFIKNNLNSSWKELFIKEINHDNILGITCVSDIGEYMNADSSLMDVKLQITDTYKRTTEHVFEPAFAIGDNIKTDVSNKLPISRFPKEYELDNIYPNPFNMESVITYSLPQVSRISIKVFDVLGRLVKTLVDESQEAGKYKVSFSGRDLSSGIYFCQIRAGKYVKTVKMILQK